MPKVYIASKFHHGAKWLQLREESFQGQSPWFGIQFTSRWFKQYYDRVPDEPQYCKIGWIHDLEDVEDCDVLIIYGEPGEHLRGALVEAGAALAFGKHVIAVGGHEDYGTWQYHPMVHLTQTMDEALVILKCFDFDRSR